jgi:hypothetical protein
MTKDLERVPSAVSHDRVGCVRYSRTSMGMRIHSFKKYLELNLH